MTVVAAAKPLPATTPTKTVTTTSTYVAPKTSTYSPSYTTTNYSGPAQLSVRVISGNINANGDGTVTFDIANIGGSPSGSYYFSAQLPTAQSYPYQSPLQTSLAPGSHITSTLNFTDAASGGGLFSVTIEGNAANSSSDYATMQIPGPTNYNNSNYGYQEAPYMQYRIRRTRTNIGNKRIKKAPARAPFCLEDQDERIRPRGPRRESPFLLGHGSDCACASRYAHRGTHR